MNMATLEHQDILKALGAAIWRVRIGSMAGWQLVLDTHSTWREVVVIKRPGADGLMKWGAMPCLPRHPAASYSGTTCRM